MGYKKNQSFIKKVTVTEKYLSPVIIFSLIMAIIIFRDEERSGRFKKLFIDKIFLTSLMCIGLFSTYNLMQNGDDKEIIRRKRATREAVLGFIIAIMAYLDLRSAPFWIIFVVSYYYE